MRRRLMFPLAIPQIKRYEGTEGKQEREHIIEQSQLKATIDTEEVLFILKPLLEPLVHELDRVRLGLKELVDDMQKARTFYDATPAISNSVAYEVTYNGYKYLFLYSTQAFTLATNSGGSLSIPANQWVNISLPRGMKVTAQGISDSSPIVVLIRATDELLSLAGVGGALGTVNQGTPPWTILGSSSVILNLSSAARATYSQQFTGLGGYTELACDFNVTALTGGTAPTVTFKVSRIGADGVLYQLESATALSAAGVISYNIGAGLDNKSFGDGIQVDMVVTGAPTNITFSASIKAKI